MRVARHALWLFLFSGYAGAVNLQEGQWRIAVQIEIPNASGPNAGPARQEVCLKPQDVKRFVVPPNSPCRVSDLVSTEREMRWKLVCQSGSLRSSGSGVLEFSGNRFKGVIESQSGPPYNMRISQKIEGLRLGPCKFSPRNPGAPSGLKPYGE